MSSSIWWSDKRLKGKFWYEEFAPILLEIMDKEGTNKIDVKYPHNSIDTYTRAELESDLGVKASKVVQVEALAMYESKLPTFVDFYNFVINNTDPKEVNKSYFKYKLTADIDIQVNYDRIIHIYNKHNLTALMAQQLLEGLKEVKLASVSSKQGALAGTTILCQVLSGEGGVALIKGKTLCLGTLFIGGAKEVEDWVKKEGPYALLNVSTNGSFIGDLLGQVTASYRPSILLSAIPDKSQPNYYNFTKIIAKITINEDGDTVLPPLSEEVLSRMGLVGRSREVVLRERTLKTHQRISHPNISDEQLIEIIEQAIKSPDIVKPAKKENYWHLIKENIRITPKGHREANHGLLRLDLTLELVEMVSAYHINDKKLEKEKKASTGVRCISPSHVQAQAAAGPDFLQFVVASILLSAIPDKSQPNYYNFTEKGLNSTERVVADKRNIIERRGARQDIPNARDSEFDSGVYEMLRDNPKLMGYIEPWMDVAQVSVIEEALKAGVDVTKLQSPKYNWMQMNAILEYLKEGIDVTKYTKEVRDESIIRQIGEAIKQGMTEVQIRQMLFMKNWMQMREIRLGHKMGINVQSYATKPQMGWQQMRDIRMRLIKERAHLTASWMPVQAMAAKGKDIVQRFLALQPVDIVLSDGRVVTAKWDKYAANKNTYTLGHSTGADRRFKIRNIEKLPMYISFAKHIGTEEETGKDSPAHKGVKWWYYAEVNIETDEGDFKLLINIRDKGDEQFFYEIAIT